MDKIRTSRNRYSADALLATCVVLRRLAAPARWADLEPLFGKCAPQLSKISWEAIEHFLDSRGHLLTGFIDGTVLGIARPKGNLAHRVVYNGHKRKHALKYQAINTPDGMIVHLHGPLEGRRHDWTPYIRSGLDDMLPDVLQFNGVRYCIYGDSRYNGRWFMEVPFQGATLTAAQKAFNRAMSGVRITVEWVFEELKMHLAIVGFKRKMKL